MLQRQTIQAPHIDGASGQSLTPRFFYEILKRRALYFVIPFLAVLSIGVLATAMWPAKYIAQGTILVQSQEIPSDLVRPTIAALANDRIQIIEQRVMTRDNLLTIAKKYRLTSGWLERMSGTEIVDFIRKRTIIKPSEQKLETRKKEAIAFTIGFEYERPDVAAKVANELVTMLLTEDVRSRTDFAAQTTRFLGQEVTRLEGRLSSLDSQIIALRKSRFGGLGDSDLDGQKQLAALKAELLTKSAVYSASHPDIQALKRKIAALEKSALGSAPAANVNDSAGPAASEGLDTLETQRTSIIEELNKATQKLSAARLGESLEKGQHSERLEVIEQPTIPQKPVSPNRPKLLAMFVALAVASGGGAVIAAEFLNQSIRRSADLFSIMDRQLIVSIPYIATHKEVVRRKKKTRRTIGLLAGAALGAAALLFFLLPPVDIMFDRVMSLLSQ
jgi:uncharacterized protein involved in exopolysaccharide biosynthesis